jgi:hypothetical protein
MANYTKVHSDTEVLGKVSPALFQALLDMLPALGAALNWERLACAFLADVLRQIALTGDPLVIGHAEFGRILWGDDMTKVAARRRMSRAIQALMRCQSTSGFLAVWVDLGKRIEKDGEVEYIYTTYRLRDFFVVFGDIQALAVEQDLMALPMKQRRQTQLAIVQSVCDARQYQRIPDRMRQQRHFQKNEAKPEPLPQAEALPASLPYSKALDWYCEQLKAYLISLGKGRADAGFNAVVAEASKAIRQTERAALDVIHGRKLVKAGGIR